MNSMKLVIPFHFISWKKTPNDAVTPQRQSQFTPKMKANAVPRWLSSLVWTDQDNECNGITSFMEFMIYFESPKTWISIWLYSRKRKAKASEEERKKEYKEPEKEQKEARKKEARKKEARKKEARKKEARKQWFSLW